MPYPKKVTEAIKKLLAKEVPARQSHHLCSFAVVDSGEESKCWWNNNCLNPLRGSARLEEPTHLIIATKDVYKLAEKYGAPIGSSHKHFNRYVDWLINKSIFSSCFVSKNVEQILSDGCVVIDCDVPANIMLCAATAFRYTWEFPWFIDNWAGLVDCGVHKGQAFVLAHLYSQPYGEGYYTKGVSSHNSNHILIDYYKSVKLLEVFTSKNYDSLVKEGTFKELGFYSKVQYTFSAVEGKMLGGLLDEVKTKSFLKEGDFGDVTVGGIAGDNPHSEVIKVFKPYLEIE